MKVMRNVADVYENALGEQPPDLIASAEEVDMVAAISAQASRRCRGCFRGGHSS
jgi:hypothetical protein